MAESTRGGCYCRPELRGKGLKGRTSLLYCPDCNKKIRGKNHNDGDHHKGRVPKCKKH